MKYKLLFSLFLASFILPSVLALCSPQYSCDDWSECSEGLQIRTCKELSCGLPDNIERRLCTSNSDSCQVKYSCTPWTGCSYLDKTQDILNDNIRFKGYQERACSDLNACADNFVEQKSCEDSYKVKFIEINQCGNDILVAVDPDSNRPLSHISLDAWRQKRLDISFVQSNFSYCPYCYNGVKDGDEEQIDCGGSCIECSAETGIRDQMLLISSTWLLSIILFSGFVYKFVFDKRLVMRKLIFRANKALDERNKSDLIKQVKKIRAHYNTLTVEQKKEFDRELDKIYRRV